jgi:two-component system, LytTR family, response regulator
MESVDQFTKEPGNLVPQEDASKLDEETKRYLTRIPLKSGKATRYVHIREIEFFQSSGNYVEVSHKDRSGLIRHSLGALEGRLSPKKFLRISRTVIVNLDHVTELHSKGKRNSTLFLTSGKELRVTRNLDRFDSTISYS